METVQSGWFEHDYSWSLRSWFCDKLDNLQFFEIFSKVYKSRTLFNQIEWIGEKFENNVFDYIGVFPALTNKCITIFQNSTVTSQKYWAY